MAKMTLAQARKMRDGVLKGDSAIARAWKELINGTPAAEEPPSPTAGSPAERGAKTAARFRAEDNSWD